jgi:hypothetical protein
MFCPPYPAEKDLLARFTRLKLGPAETVQFSSFSPEVQQAVQNGIKNSDADLCAMMNKVNTDEVSSGDFVATRDFLKETTGMS